MPSGGLSSPTATSGGKWTAEGVAQGTAWRRIKEQSHDRGHTAPSVGRPSRGAVCYELGWNRTTRFLGDGERNRGWLWPLGSLFPRTEGGVGKHSNPMHVGCGVSSAHKESLLSVALPQTLNPNPAPGPPEGPEVGEDAEKSCPKTW